MTTDDTQQILDRILGELKSSETTRCLNAINELKTLKFSSPAILSQLEKMAIHHEDNEVRNQARQSLVRPVHQVIRSRMNKLNRSDRNIILRQIEQWEQAGLLGSDVTQVLRGRYDFDTAPPPVAFSPVPVITDGTPSAPPPQPITAGPRPTLTQTLLSEASIRIYLYLGAFFVIASALILAAVVEAARLPILTAATLGFGGVSLLLRKHLPQPSFALFIVFSFLLPIDANVLEETIGFTEPSLSIYWTLIFLFMAAIWGLSVWFYGSRFFSAVAFVSLSLAFYRAAEIFNTELELQIFFGLLASLIGLAGTFVLRKWKDNKFSLPVFLLAHVQVLILLIASMGLGLYHVFGSGVSGGWWMLAALTWLTAASFYTSSDLLSPGLIFPWMAAAALVPLPWFILESLDAAQPVYAFGFWGWGAAFALASETVFRFSFERLKRYHWPFLAGSLPLFLTSFIVALFWERPVLTFAVFALSSLVYAVLHLFRPRWYVWSLALLSAMLAFFTFFYLPPIEYLEVPFVYQVLIASALLVVPELFTKSPISLNAQSRWPAIALGTSISLLGTTLALADTEHSGRGALTLIVYAILLTLHALHGKREWLGYIAAATESLAILYALDHFNLDLWLPAITLLSALYYTTGFFFRRMDDMKTWGIVLINSGLALGTLLSFSSLILSAETSGWYLILIAVMFSVELYARPLVWLEVVVETLLSMALYLILNDFHVDPIGHFLFGASLIWLGGDLIFKHLLRGKRVYRPIVLAAGYSLVFMGTFALGSEADPGVPALYFSLYAVFFAFYASMQREARLGYPATAFLPLAIIKLCEVVGFEKWIFPLIILSVLYYGSGYWLRRKQKGAGWDKTLLFSGLGLGILTSFAAPFHGGLDSSIPVAIAATLIAMEAFARRNVWWALPANALYLMSYFMILAELNVDEPQFYSIGTALLGMLMHYLLTRAGSKTGAFIAGMLSQLVLLGTTYIQMMSTEKLSFFFVLFIQSIIVLIYGLIQRSRSLVITPIAFAVIGVVTVVYSALKGLGPVILIGSTGLVLLMAGIVAVLMRERITKLGEQLSDWKP